MYSGVMPLNISDHDLIFVTKKKAVIKRETVDFHGRSYRNYDKEALHTHMNNINWDEYWLINDPSDCWEYIVNAIEGYLNPICPIKKRRVKSSNEPWLNNEILEAIFDKDQAWRRAKLSKK